MGHTHGKRDMGGREGVGFDSDTDTGRGGVGSDPEMKPISNPTHPVSVRGLWRTQVSVPSSVSTDRTGTSRLGP